MSTASLQCRTRVQRLQAVAYAATASGSRGRDPWVLRPTRLHWHSNLSGKHRTPCDLGLCKRKPGLNTRPLPAKTAASCAGKGSKASALRLASSRYHTFPQPACACRLEARAGTVPPPFSTGPPAPQPFQSLPSSAHPGLVPGWERVAWNTPGEGCPHTTSSVHGSLPVPQVSQVQSGFKPPRGFHRLRFCASWSL